MAEGRLQQELLHKNVTIEALASALKKATDEKELLEKSNEETIQSLIQDVEGKNSQWRSILQKAEEEKEKIKKEKDELKKNNDTNEHVIQTLKWDVEDLKSKLQKSKEENEELEKSRTTVHSLKLDVKDVKSKLQKANAEKEKLKKNNDGNEETIRSLKFDLKEMEDKLCVQRLKLCVVSINIGKSYTELGFSMISHQRDIKTIRFHHNVDTINSCTACPSTVLLDKNGEFVSFGCKAEDEYSDKVKFHDNNDEYCLIHINDFLSDSRQSLDGTNTNRSTPIKGVSLDTVLKYIVRYLVDMTMETMNDRLSLVKGVDECLWIFPVHPSQFSTFSHGLKTGISEAGIKEGDYRLVPEPVLVGLHSQRILLKQKATDLEGGTFVVLDVGGTTTKISIHKQETTNSIDRSCLRCGFKKGSYRYLQPYTTNTEIEIEKGIQQMLLLYTGVEVLQEIMSTYKYDYLEFVGSTKKKIMSLEDSDDEFIITLNSIGSLLQANERGIDKPKENEDVRRIRDKLLFRKTKLIPLFEKAFDSVIDALKNAIEGPRGVTTIVLIGGFSFYKPLQSAIEKTFPWDKLVVSDKFSTRALISGALSYGHLVLSE